MLLMTIMIVLCIMNSLQLSIVIVILSLSLSSSPKVSNDNPVAGLVGRVLYKISALHNEIESLSS